MDWIELNILWIGLNKYFVDWIELNIFWIGLNRKFMFALHGKTDA